MKTKPKAGQTRTRNHRNPTGSTHRTVSAARLERKRLNAFDARIEALEHAPTAASAFHVEALDAIVMELRQRVAALEMNAQNNTTP